MKLGKYKHYKGNFYEVIGVAHHSETLEELVVYRALYDVKKYGRNSLWVRPKTMFQETVVIDGKKNFTLYTDKLILFFTSYNQNLYDSAIFSEEKF